MSIHRKDCPNVLNLSKNPERRVEIEWTAAKEDRFFVKLYNVGHGPAGAALGRGQGDHGHGTHIQHADMRTADGG